MRASFVARLVLIVAIVAVVGLPGARQFDVPSVEAQPSTPSARQPMPPGDVWTGDVPGSSASEQAAPVPGRSGASVDSASVGSPGAATDGASVSNGSGAATRSTAAATDSRSTEPLIVRFKPGAGQTGQVDAHVRAGAVRARTVALTNTVVVDVPAGRAVAALAEYNARPDVLYAEPDYPVQAYYTPNDPQYASQWALPKVGAPAAWDVTRGSATVRVAVVDCGVFSAQTGRNHSDGQAGHPDLRGRVILNQDFTSSATGFDDYCDHGTHVAGIIAANGNNGVGISGLAPEVSLMNAKVLSDSGSGSTSNILNGVSWAVQNGAHVVNMSLGRDGACSQSENDMMNYAWSQGVVVVAAAGNSSLSSSGSPANCANVVSVASTTSTDAVSSFSNYGTNVDVAAPGSGILSTVRSGGYASYNGTSMASPYVAGLAGLVFSLNPNRTPQSVVDVIRTTAAQITGTGTKFAWGRIDAAAAVGGGGAPVPPAPTATSTQIVPPTLTPIPTSTLGPIPTPSTCPSPRPPITVSTSPPSGGIVDGTMQAGAGVIRSVFFTRFSNAAVTIGSSTNVSQPFLFTPNPLASQLSFRISQLNPNFPGTINLTITDDCGPWTTFVGGGVGGFQRGTVAGTIRNATTNEPIVGASIVVLGTQRAGGTDSTGAFGIGNVPAGARTVEISKAGYASQSVPVTVVANQTATVNVSLTPTTTSQPNILVSLTWGASPSDLDIHLSGPTTGGNRFHLYWNNSSAVSHALLSPDAHNGFGPETVTIRRSSQTNAWVPGEYRIWAHNFSGTPGYANSSAAVTVSRAGTTLGSYNASAASGTSTRLIWRSVNLTIDASGNVSLTPVQQFVNGSSGTILRFLDGGDDLEWPATGKP